VIAEGADGGEEVYRFPWTGNETVLDALAAVPAHLTRVGRVHVVRRADGGSENQVLPVDWKAITQEGQEATNYRLLPGDRVYVKKAAPKPPPGAPRTDVMHMNRREFMLPFQGAGLPQGVDRLVLLLSDDEGRHYRQVAEVRPEEQQGFRVTVPGDGVYWFVIRTRDRNGRLEPSDVQAATPSLKVCVDTQSPEVTIREARRAGATLDLQWEVGDANLDVETLTLECRPPGEGAWSPLAVPKVAEGRRSLALPESFPGGPVELRIQVRDLAGNVGTATATLR
jgi:hypothetical protein